MFKKYTGIGKLFGSFIKYFAIIMVGNLIGGTLVLYNAFSSFRDSVLFQYGNFGQVIISAMIAWAIMVMMMIPPVAMSSLFLAYLDNRKKL